MVSLVLKTLTVPMRSSLLWLIVFLTLLSCRPSVAESDGTSSGRESSATLTPVVANGPAPAVVPSNDDGRRYLSLRYCFDRADLENKEIKVATAGLSAAQAQIVIAKAIPNPIFNMSYGFGPAWRYIVAGNNQQFGWTEEIQVAGRRTKKAAVARSSYFQTALNVEAVRFSVHNRIRRAYCDLSAAVAYKALIAAQAEVAAQLQTIAQERFQAGSVPGSQVLQAKLSVMQFKAQGNLAQQAVRQDTARLVQLLGEIPTGDESVRIDGNRLFDLSEGENSLVPDADRTLPPLAQLLPAGLKQRKDLQAMIQQAYTARRAITLAKTARIPDPVLGFDYLFTTYKPYQPLYFNPDGTGLPTAANRVPAQPGYLLTVAEEAPIFYQYQGEVNQARANLNQQLKQNDLSAAQIATDIVSAYEALTVARLNIRKFRESLLPRAQSVALLSMKGYRLGRTDLSTAILAQQQYQQIRASYFAAVVAYQTAWADLEQAVGVPLNL